MRPHLDLTCQGTYGLMLCPIDGFGQFLGQFHGTRFEFPPPVAIRFQPSLLIALPSVIRVATSHSIPTSAQHARDGLVVNLAMTLQKHAACHYLNLSLLAFISEI